MVKCECMCVRARVCVCVCVCACVRERERERDQANSGKEAFLRECKHIIPPPIWLPKSSDEKHR